MFLSRWLPEWTDERAVAHDWRVLYLDAFAAHLTENVSDLAFERGFVPMYHGGGTTGVCQVNDTDLHAAFERDYLNTEMVSFFEQGLLDPGNIGRTRQQIVDDVVAVWRGLEHSEGVRGHKRTGLSVDLSGSEDHLINRDARVFWDELAFGQVRDAEVRKVQDAVARGDLSWCHEDIESLREHFPDSDVGVLIEGQELDCMLEDDEQQWSDSDNDLEDDRMSSDDEGSSIRASKALVPVSLPIVASDTPEEVEEATIIAQRLQTLEKIDSAARCSQLPAVQFHVQREIRSLTKHGRSAEGGTRASALLRRFVRKRREDEELRFRALRAENQERAHARRKVKDDARKFRVAREIAKAKAKSAKEALAKLPKEFDAAMLGQGHASGGTRAHCAQREACLERLRLRAPPLPRELDAAWDNFKKDYAKWMGTMHKGAVGIKFFEVVRDVMARLGHHLLNDDGSKAEPSAMALEPVDDAVEPSVAAVEPVGNANAFKAFMIKARGRIPKAATSLRI